MDSIQDDASAAAAGVYLPRRILRRSLSREVTEAMVDVRVEIVCEQSVCMIFNLQVMKLTFQGFGTRDD